jgi:predicted nucleic acid-binding protein
MPEVVSNTTPLIALSKISKLELEKRLLHEVLPFAYELREKGIWVGDDLIEYIKEIEERS